MTQCALLGITCTTLHRGVPVDVFSVAIPAYTRTLFGFVAIEEAHRHEYQIQTHEAGTAYSIGDYALWLLRKAAEEPTEQEVDDDARS